MQSQAGSLQQAAHMHAKLEVIVFLASWKSWVHTHLLGEDFVCSHSACVGSLQLLPKDMHARFS